MAKKNIKVSKTDDEGTVRVVINKEKRSLLDDIVEYKGKKKSFGLEEHPLNLTLLAKHVERSGILQPPIKSYVTNVHTTGYSFKPAIDLKAPDAREKIKDAMFVEKLIIAYDNDIDIDTIKEPSDEEVENKFESVKKKARLELAIATNFFESCVPDGDFTSLRTRSGYDYEYFGGSYWEVLRGENNKPRTLEYVKARNIRIAKEDENTDNSVSVRTLQRVSPLTHEVVKTRRTFKRFAEVDSSGRPIAWFKEFGNPKLMSQKTGLYYSDVTEMLEKEKNDKVATELITFQQYSLSSQYGTPRWSGHLPSVLGSRELDETNFDYFLNNAIPALALLVSGGRFGSGAKQKLEEFFSEEIIGSNAHHKLLVLEAESQRRGSTGQTVNPRIEFVPLRNAQLNDALFQEYDKRNTIKIDTSFRLPTSLKGGEKSDVNDMRFAEEQVFGPERSEFDSTVNKFLMPELGVTFWKFVSNTISPRDPEVLGNLTLDAAKIGLIVPSEGRNILEKAIGYELVELDKQWVDQPIPFTVAALGVKAGPAEAVREQGRQAGNPSPNDQLISELGINAGDNATSRSNDSGALTALDAIAALNKPKKDDE